jgi:thioredoxin-like negative regulator of GroEL
MEANLEILAFGAPNCPACKMITPALQELAQKYSRKVIPLIPQQHREVARQHKIQVIPTLIKLSDGVEVARIVGKQPYAVLEEFFNG